MPITEAFPLSIAQPVPARAVLIGAAVAAAVIVGLAVWLILRRRGSKKSAEARCGRCGYGVTGLPTFTCPECGGDLRQVGIVRGTAGNSQVNPARDAARLMAVLALWTLVYAALYACIGTNSYPRQPWDSANRPEAYGVVDAYLWPYQGKSNHAVILEPRTEAYRRVTITEEREARFQGWRNAPQLRWTGDSPNVGLSRFAITVQLDTLGGKATTMQVDPATLVMRYDDPRNPGQTVSGALDGERVWGWLIVSGVDMPAQAIKDEADVIADVITRSVRMGTVGGPAWATGRLERIVAQQRDATNEAVQAYPFKQTRGLASDVYGPAWSIYWLSIPFGLGVYSYGSNWLWGRHRKRTMGAVKAAENPAGELPASAVAADPERRRKSRTLTILFTDLKDYTARTEAASRDGLRAVLRKNREVVEGVVSATDGTIVKTIGDAYLVTFESATDAVLAGLEIQRAAARYNAAVDLADRLDYRIAVCTGEVTLEHGDVFGTPVNVAARVQALAEPGSVYFTESTLHAVNPAEVGCEEIGPRELKGITAPVRVYEARAREGPGATA